MIDVVALGEVLIDFASRGTDDSGYPRMQALPGGAPANFLAAFGVSLAMVTMGPKGCLLKTKNALYQAAGPKVSPVETTGAGDIFGGTAVCRLLELNKPFAELTAEDLHYIGAFASTAASLSTEIPGWNSQHSRKMCCAGSYGSATGFFGRFPVNCSQ